ncbi:ATP-binding protein [Catelliglobosispora koreensis]|uniref:ATP-binding protein n=1 Tax=Catelliglobosispora koreensis TaxID=129052 RepID=UPI000381CE1B|nr:ATP-binding protein [Catelliglobosispora koreensis]
MSTLDDGHLYRPDSLTGETFDSDAERVTETVSPLGPSADNADVPVTFTWADLATAPGKRAPILPAWLTDKRQRRATLRAITANVWYWLRFHGVRSPKYLLKTGWYALTGFGRSAGKVLKWASAEEGNFALRQHAADTNDAYTWQALNRTRAKESRARWWAVAAVTLLLGCGLPLAYYTRLVPMWGWYTAAALAAVGLARVGRPADKPITDRITAAKRFTRLTAEMVRNALLALNIPAMKDAASIEFVHPGIHRDGPGWLARVNLPIGLEAVKVLDRRGALSSSLRLPVDQVWPSAGPDHAGQLDLWVGYQPASAMGQPKWSLAAADAITSVFAENEFGTDERQRPVKTSLFARSFLIGGQPGSGKSYAARSLAFVAALDPYAELKIAEFKGTGDFIDFAPLCSTYVVGVDDKALEEGAAILRWALAEAERRGKRILAAKQRGDAPEGKVTPELARKAGSGLHPVVIIIDEAHELFAALPSSADDAERAIKRCRALGIIFVLATQIPDKTSLPPNITRCVTNRWCLSVAGQVENDMILGTGAYKRGITGTVYRPVLDAGWGVQTGGAAPVSVRSQYPDAATAKAMLGRALALRGGTPVGGQEDLPQARDLVADLAAVAGSNGQHWAPAAAALAERWPNAYPGLTAEALSELARAAGVPSVDLKISRRNLKGYRLDAVRTIISQRNGHHDPANN